MSGLVRHDPKRNFDSRTRVRGGMWRIVFVALAACATYRALPLDPPPPGPSAMTLRYERKRFHLFTSTRDDARIEAVFGSDTTIATVVSQPHDGVFVSTDAGADWTFAQTDGRFRDVMFDGSIIVGLGGAHIHCSRDGGKTWRSSNEMAVEALAVAGGAIYAASAGHLYVSQDCAQSWKTLTPQIPAGWRARSIAVDRQSIYMSVRAARETPPLTTLLDATSDAAVAALTFVDGRDSRRAGLDAVWVTHDGGTLWQRSSLALDAWLAVVDGKVWAVAADPMIEGAALVRRSPQLAAALDGQLRGARIDASALRASFGFPGRDKLLHAIAAPAFRSTDEGATWARMDEAPVAVRAVLERQWRAHLTVERAPDTPRRSDRGGGRAGGGGPAGGGRGRRGGRGSAPPAQPAQPAQPAARAVPSEMFLTLLDPQRLLARFNSGRRLTGIAGDKLLYAYVPTQQFWDSLVDTMANESDAEGEIALGSGRPGPGSAPGGAFELLSSTDGGAHWSELPLPQFDHSLRERSILPYPVDIAAVPPQAFVVFAAIDRGGSAWRDAWRWAQ